MYKAPAAIPNMPRSESGRSSAAGASGISQPGPHVLPSTTFDSVPVDETTLYESAVRAATSKSCV
jgi:hypothetical protein